jgi:hypothetical protein
MAGFPYGAEVRAAIAYFRRPRMSAGVDFAVHPHLGSGDKPKVFPSLAALCLWIHAQRGEAGLELQDRDLQVQGSAAPVRVVEVWLQDLGGGRGRFLGYVWLKGCGWQALQISLREARRDPTPHVEAA